MIKSYLKNTEFWTKFSNSDFYLKLRNKGAYDIRQAEHQFYKNWLGADKQKHALIFDVGANNGSKSYHFSKLADKVLAFEPSGKMFAQLTKRFNNTNVVLFNCALGKESATGTFFEIEGNEAYNSLSQKHIDTTVTKRHITEASKINSKEVAIETLEKYITTYGKPVYIKIDVEGFEYEVIQGLKTPVQFVSFEVNLPEFLDESNKIIEYLSNISGDKYLFNFSNDEGFLLKDFVGTKEAIQWLSSTKLNYLEVYAQLQH